MQKNYFVRENIFFLITLLLCIVVLFQFLFPFGLGVTFAYLLEPVVEKLQNLFHTKKRIWKWVFSFVLIVLTIVLIFGPILTLVTTAIQQLLNVLSGFQGQAQEQNLTYLFAQKISTVFQHFSITYSIDEIILKFTDILKSTSHALLLDLGTALYATPRFILKFIVFILTWYFFLVKGKIWRARFLSKIFPWEKERSLIAHTFSSILKALIVANVLVAIVQAFLITICFAAFEIPRFILLGMIAFFISFVPVLGTAPLMLCAAAWCYFSEGRTLATVGILICGVVISLLDNILRPYFMKGGAEMQFFWVFLAIICGISLLGIPGAIIGPVVFALFATALRTLEYSNDRPS